MSEPFRTFGPKKKPQSKKQNLGRDARVPISSQLLAKGIADAMVLPLN